MLWFRCSICLRTRFTLGTDKSVQHYTVFIMGGLPKNEVQNGGYLKKIKISECPLRPGGHLCICTPYSFTPWNAAMYLMTIRTTRIVFLFNFHDSWHYADAIMGTIASQITSLTIVYSTVYSDADQRKYQTSVSLAFVRGIHRWPVNSPHKWPVMRK